ncbi:unnamed protein product [Rhizophagus irregularis]|nr:unnamed protein product [Rhizophagus irregularis]
MTCSKIFSGDLPELTYEVIKYFQNDYSTLHSCILVNRLWCRLSIPLLWENPFSIYAKNHNYIEIYLLYINDDLKTTFYKYKVINNSLPSSTLFNYPKFLKYLNTYEFIFSVRKWFGSPIKYINLESISYLTDFYIMIDICVSLFKIFIENEVNLHTLEIDSTSIIYDSIYPSNILELILQNTNFIHNIKNLKFHIIDNNRNIALIKDRISQIINLQQNLKQILINRSGFLLCQSLFLSKDYNCSNTLNTIVFYYCDFKESKSVYQMFNLMENIKQNLNYLLIDISEYTTISPIISTSSIILQNLGQVLPSKLEYVRLALNIKESDFRLFLENSQDIFINKLFIKQSGSDDILHYIKEYIMKERRVRYLAINIENRIDLFDWKDEVKEFKLYNIIVRSCNDLYIYVDNYIKNID